MKGTGETTPTGMSPSRVAVVGAGVAGLTCAHRLIDGGISVTVLDEREGPAGRASTRRVSRGREEGAAFDYGAQYFTVRDERFRRRVAEWRSAGIVAPWEARIVAQVAGRDPGGVERLVGVPAMDVLGDRLSRGVDVRQGVRVVALEAGEERRDIGRSRWFAVTDGSRRIGPFDAVVVAVPAPRVPPLLGTAAPELARAAAGHRMLPCWAVLAAFDAPLQVEFDGMFLEEGPLAWVARNSSKPGRPGRPETWVLHAGPSWSEAHLEADPAAVKIALLSAFFQAVTRSEPDPALLEAHRWRWARSADPGEEGCLASTDGSAILAGDWLAGDRVEGAYLSGLQAAARLLGRELGG